MALFSAQRTPWLAVAFVCFVVALLCVSSSMIGALPLGAMLAGFGVAAFFGRRPFALYACAFLLAVAGVSSCAAVEASLHYRTCGGQRELIWAPAPQPEDLDCSLG